MKRGEELWFLFSSLTLFLWLLVVRNRSWGHKNHGGKKYLPLRFCTQVRSCTFITFTCSLQIWRIGVTLFLKKRPPHPNVIRRRTHLKLVDRVRAVAVVVLNRQTTVSKTVDDVAQRLLQPRD